jgi:hypothetical protein
MKRLASAAGAIGRGAKGTAIETIVGLVTFYGHRMASEKVAFARDHTLAVPIALVAAGHFAKRSRRFGALGAALCGAGGYAGAQAFELQKAVNAANPPAAGTQGLDDTGALVSPSDVGALVAPSDVGDYQPDYSSAYNLGL